MKNDIVQIVLALLTLILGCALEELLPKVVGVGFPLLMSATVFVALRRRLPFAICFAVAAGAAEDSLSGLPPTTSASFFLAITAVARWSEFPNSALIMAYPLYQVWLRLWIGNACGDVFYRILVAVPYGVMTTFASWVILDWWDRRSAVGES